MRVFGVLWDLGRIFEGNLTHLKIQKTKIVQNILRKLKFFKVVEKSLRIDPLNTPESADEIYYFNNLFQFIFPVPIIRFFFATQFFFFFENSPDNRVRVYFYWNGVCVCFL